MCHVRALLQCNIQNLKICRLLFQSSLWYWVKAAPTRREIGRAAWRSPKLPPQFHADRISTKFQSRGTLLLLRNSFSIGKSTNQATQTFPRVSDLFFHLRCYEKRCFGSLIRGSWNLSLFSLLRINSDHFSSGLCTVFIHKNVTKISQNLWNVCCKYSMHCLTEKDFQNLKLSNLGNLKFSEKFC